MGEWECERVGGRESGREKERGKEREKGLNDVLILGCCMGLGGCD